MTMDRREILKAALGSSVAIAGLSWSSLQAVAQQASQNTLTWIWDIAYQNMNPAIANAAEPYVLGNVYETLFAYKDGKILPKLATAWESAEGGKTWTVKLREGVKFHDGSPLNSAAVKKSFEYTRDLGKGKSYLIAGLEHVDTPDDLTVVFRFKDTIGFDLVAGGSGFVIGTAGIDKGDEWLNQGNAIGTGPYKLTEFQQGKLIVLDKFEDYWGGWETGQIDRVLHPYVAEMSTRIQMVRSGEANIAQRVPASQIDSLEALPNVSVADIPSWRTQYYMINTQKYPTDNLKFRQALLSLWDHESVLKHIFHGIAQKPVGPVVSTLWGHGTYDVGTFDPQKALSLLEESGIPKKDWKIKALYYAGNQEQIDAIELFRANAEAVGLEVELELEAVATTYNTKARSLETTGHLNAMVMWPSYPSPHDFLAMFKSEEKPVWNFSYYHDEEYDRLVGKGFKLEGADKDAAAKDYIAAQDRLMQNAVTIFYADVNRVAAYSSDIKGMEQANNPAYEWISLYSLSR
ncbi:MAG: ABC transporter substrate-binding protein [Mesorhizobium sp.]|uniref:ABC transporter substrate-binding protein n=1 Tax=Mesorhizobium sp. TaxID=1871066 RepID=UPI000FE59EC4|nr:ABC transporter substrate-binding protein [Mesorhizobium sp.]RWJ39830.1 MAG: ABC transporter substrate-binding protein [Mesorhizobium sp.]RWJ81443.1 MAG: ABC transporter substrate-binding protein [Mesorhizobium sp.]TIR08829.1 MAG: ABC transporter substrate-binding protein [Mesorhizobium sp.]